MLPANQLNKINLNLLVSLQALLEEANVTRAALRLHMTQSAMSKNLAQLRELLQDPLLVRVPKGLALTDRGREIKPLLDRLLSELGDLVAPQTFTPETCEVEFRIAATDYVAQYLLPQALESITRDASHLRICIQLWDTDSLADMQAGRIDLATSIVDQMPAGIYRRKIGEDRFVCLIRRGHPLAGEPMTLEAYCRYPHAAINTGGDKIRVIDRELQRLGYKRRLHLQVPFYSSALEFVARTDLLLTLPQHIARNLAPIQDLVQLELPFPSPSLEYSLIWHERCHQEPAHRWFRQRLHEAFKSSLYAQTSP